MLRKPSAILAPFVVFALLACFGGVKKTGKVVDYKAGKVITKKGFYQVGELSPDWYRVNLDVATISFRNDSLQSAISTDAYCDQAYDDAPLSALAGHLFAGLQNIKIEKQEPLTLSAREALRTSLSASLDGVPVRVETVVVKKNWCLFDFFLVSPPEQHVAAIPHFEQFFRGFDYSGDI